MSGPGVDVWLAGLTSGGVVGGLVVVGSGNLAVRGGNRKEEIGFAVSFTLDSVIGQLRWRDVGV